MDAARLHHEYATARDEFRAALRTVVAFHHPAAQIARSTRHAATCSACSGDTSSRDTAKVRTVLNRKKLPDFHISE
jgi:hypothetical protein